AQHRDRRLGPRAVGGAAVRRCLGRHRLALGSDDGGPVELRHAGARHRESAHRQPRDQRHLQGRLVDLGGARSEQEALRLHDGAGGFKRNDDGQSSYDNNEWSMVDYRAADALRRAGRSADADALVNGIVDKASANFYLLPELYNAVQADGQIGKYTGAIPMVG